jgi:formylglycine-generating enzyme required for sulfatase activity
VIEELLKENPLLAGKWATALTPIREHLRQPLEGILGDPKRKETARLLATNLLADYFADDAELLADLAARARPVEYAILLPALKKQQKDVIDRMKAKLNKPFREEKTEENRETLARQQANCAVTLLLLDDAEQVWPLFKHNDDPRLRTYLIHDFAALGVNPQTLVERLLAGLDGVSAQQAIILSLGEYGMLDALLRKRLFDKLKGEYQTNPDPGLHSAIGWLLREKWNHSVLISEIDEGLKHKDVRGRKWYVNSQGDTMVIIEGPVTVPGSTVERQEEFKGEPAKRKAMPICRVFAVGTKEVTIEQYNVFTKATNTSHPGGTNRYRAGQNGPMIAVTWYDAALYCNWLSRKEKLEECYPNDELVQAKKELDLETRGTGLAMVHLPPRYLSKNGYRLPTEAEWEYVCRGGTTTSRFYGESIELLGKYAWYNDNSHGLPWLVGQLKPNDFGFFDMYGNAREWCQNKCTIMDGKWEEFEKRSEDSEDTDLVIDRGVLLALKGGSISDEGESLRSNYVKGYPAGTRSDTFGFRVARTCVPSK